MNMQREIDKDGLLLTENFGGLNVESSPINMPISDSPEMMNIRVSSSGVLKKRRGSRLVVGDLEKAHTLIPFKLLNGQQMMVVIEGTELIVYKVPETLGSSWVEIERCEPFKGLTDEKYYTQYSWTITKERIPRIIIVSPNNVPIQLVILQEETQYASPNTYVRIGYNYGRYYTDASNAFYFDEDGAHYATTSITQTSPTTTQFNLTTQPAASKNGVICSFAFHWWAEAKLIKNDQIYDSYFRFNTNQTADCVVETPSNLLYGLAEDYTFWDGDGTWVVPLFPEEDNGSTRNWFSPDVDPNVNATNVATAFWWSDGQYVYGGTYDVNSSTNYVASTANYIKTGLTHLTFGGVKQYSGAFTQPPDPIHYMRGHYLPFRGGLGTSGNSLLVTTSKATHTFRDGSAALQAYTTQPNYSLRESDNTVVTSAASATGDFIFFDMNYPMGIQGEAANVIYTTKPDAVGSDAASNIWAVGTDGGCMEAWGISRYANYYTSDFPDVVAQYQGRLVLSGFDSDKSAILMSCVGSNSGWDGGGGDEIKGRNWQVTLSDPTVATNPLEVRLSLEQDERITDMKQWYDSLFVTTNRSVYRVHGGGGVAVTPLNVFVSKVANVGGFRGTLTLTKEGLFFLSPSGVYQIGVNSDSESYQVANVGLKIRNHLLSGTTNGREIGYLVYDSEENVLYAGVGDYINSDIPRRLFVYFVDRKAWSEYCIHNGFFPARHGASMDGRLWFSFKHEDSTFTSASPDGLGQSSVYASEICEFKIGYQDFVKLVTLNYYDFVTNADNDFTKAAYIRVPRSTQAWNSASFTSTGDILLDLRNNPDSGNSFRLLPFVDDASNLSVSNPSTASILTLDTDYFRTNPQYLLIKDGNFDTGTLDIRLLDDNGVHSGISAYDHKNTEYLEESTAYSITSDYGTNTILAYASDNGTGYDGEDVYLAYNYPCWWFSPVFTRSNIASYKRMLYWYGMFGSTGYTDYKFGNLSQVTSETNADPRYIRWDKFNVAIVAHGIRGGQKYTDIQGAESIKDTDNDAPQWNDYWRVANYLRGNYTDFQFVIYSFNEGGFEMVGYQIDTESKGRTSRRARYG